MIEQTRETNTADVVGAELAKIMAEAPEPADDQDDESGGKGRRSAAAVLISMAEERHVFGVNTDDEAYALPKAGGHVASLLRGNNGFRSDLARAYYDKHDRTAPQQALSDALQVLDAKAHDMPKTALRLRAANHSEATYVDMGDTAQRAVRIGPEGWEVVGSGVPVLFRRTRLTAEFPEPERGGTLDLLWSQLNISAEDRPLVAAFMIACLICPDVPVPVLVLLSEQGTAKSSTTRCLVRLTDPSHAEFRKPPKDPDQWVTAANGSRVVALDNLSAIPPWLSDSLCRAVTGDADIRRALYTDNDVSVIAFRRAVIVNGIDVGALAGDLAERALPIKLEPIPRRRKLTEAELNRRWDQSYPLVLGALFDLAAQVKKALPGTVVKRPPRMADFAHVLAAVDEVMGTNGLAEYTRRSGTLAAETLEANPFFAAMREQVTAPFEGTLAKLLGHIVAPDRLPKGWPANARDLLGLITRNAHALKSEGWKLRQLGKDGHEKIMLWRVEPPVPGHADDDEDDPDEDQDGESEGKTYPHNPQSPQTPGQGLEMGAGRAGKAYPQPNGHTRKTEAGHEIAGTAGQLAGTAKQGYPQEETHADQRIAGTAGIAGVKSSLSLTDDEDEALLPPCQLCGRPIRHPAARARGVCHGCRPVTHREEAEHRERQAAEQKTG